MKKIEQFLDYASEIKQMKELFEEADNLFDDLYPLTDIALHKYQHELDKTLNINDKQYIAHRLGVYKQLQIEILEWKRRFDKLTGVESELDD